MRIFVPGEPTLSVGWGAGIRQQAGGSRIRTMLRRPRLVFTVRSLLQDGRPIAVTDLAGVVLRALGEHTLETLWTSIEIGAEPGVSISDEPPPPAPRCERAVRLVFPSVPTKLAGVVPLATTRALGLELRFDGPDALADSGAMDRIGLLLASLGPILGTYHQGSRDYRVRDLRVSCGHNSASAAVTCRIWTI